MQKDNDQIFSAEIQQILSRKAGWLLRWGAVVLAGLLIVVVGLCCMIKIPQQKSAQVTIKSKASGSIIFLLNKNQAFFKGSRLAGISNANENYYGIIEISSKDKQNISPDQKVIIKIRANEKVHRLTGIIDRAKPNCEDNDFCELRVKLNVEPSDSSWLVRGLKGEGKIETGEKTMLNELFSKIRLML